jgi:hypothetical protein
VHRLQQQLELQALELLLVVGGRRGAYRYSHTRISETSWSTSTGLVM